MTEKIQTKTKTTKSKFIIILLIIAILLAVVFSYYAYSKYTSTLTGNGTATVAKWSFKVNGETTQFATIMLEDTMNNANNLAEKRIAPGTSGAILLELDGRGSEVTIDYDITLNIAQKPTNLKIYEEYTDNSYSKEVTAQDGIMTIKGTIPLEDVGSVQNKYIYWNWPYETGSTEDEIQQNDEVDTQQSSFGSIEMPITVTATQRHPESLASQITAANYGDKVNYSVTVNGKVLDDWKVFLTEGDNVYIIYGGYLPIEAVSASSGLTTSGTYGVATTTNRIDFIDSLKAKDNWSNLLTSELVTAGAFVTGSPTLEQYVESWNKKYPSDKLYINYTTENMEDGLIGCYIGTEETTTDLDATKSNSDRLYYPYASPAASAGTTGYWLASASAGNGVSIVVFMGALSFSVGTNAVRPLICLPASVLGEYTEGIWNIE